MHLLGHELGKCDPGGIGSGDGGAVETDAQPLGPFGNHALPRQPRDAVPPAGARLDEQIRLRERAVKVYFLQDSGDLLPGDVEARRFEVVWLGNRAEIDVDAPARLLQDAEELPVEADLDCRDVLSHGQFHRPDAGDEAQEEGEERQHLGRILHPYPEGDTNGFEIPFRPGSICEIIRSGSA